MRFDLDAFVADCRVALADSNPQRAVREVTARAVSDPAAVMAGIGEPTRAGLYTLHRSPDLTVLNLVWGPHMVLMPHDHRMWAVIGIYTGREDNIFWRRIPGNRIEAAGARALSVGDADLLGKDIIHSVSNPVEKLTGAIHVYGGDFFAAERSEWDPETLVEEPYRVEKVLGQFERSNRMLG
jgi:predicted metal-dependent enzyme (double-stranded beta helix superfamily)